MNVPIRKSLGSCRCLLILGVLTCFIWTTTVSAQENFLDQGDAPETTERPDLMPQMFGAVVRLVGGFLILLLLMGGVLLLLKRWQTPVSDDERPVRLLFEGSIGPKRSICLVRVGTQVLVVGVTPSNISYLTRIDDPELMDSLEPLATKEIPFKEGLERLRKRFGGGR